MRIEPEDLIVYELHVQDYTARLEGLEPGLRGTYLGLAQSGLTTPGGLAAGIDHLVELGVTAVELMPVMEYDEETGNVARAPEPLGLHDHQLLRPRGALRRRSTASRSSS